MNIFKTMAVRSLEEATRSIPVIDFARAFWGEPEGLDAVAREVRHACESVGFFYLVGHGVPQGIVDAAFEAAREFHAIPPDEKMRLALNENNIGYLAPNQSMQRASTVHKATRPNYNESFFISHDRELLNNTATRVVTVELLIECLNRGVLPHVPSRGSVGASGDLAPLAHLAHEGLPPHPPLGLGARHRAAGAVGRRAPGLGHGPRCPDQERGAGLHRAPDDHRLAQHLAHVQGKHECCRVGGAARRGEVRRQRRQHDLARLDRPLRQPARRRRPASASSAG